MSSSKAKKLARKAETALANEHLATVKRANALADPLAPVAPMLMSFELESIGGAGAGAEAETACPVCVVGASAASLAPATLEAAHALCRANMEALYEPVWGPWDAAKKRQQLSDGASRFLLAYAPAAPAAAAGKGAPAPATATGGGDGGGPAPSSADSRSPEDQEGGRRPPAAREQGEELVGLLNYRFELDDAGGTGRGLPTPAAYCYELQLSARARRRGLGRRLMRVLELAAARAGMRAVILTVLDANAAARALYAGLGYSLDPNSPDPEDADEAHAGYRILRKDFPEAVVAASRRAAEMEAAKAAAGAGAAAAGGGGAAVAAAAAAR